MKTMKKFVDVHHLSSANKQKLCGVYKWWGFILKIHFWNWN